MAKKATKKTRLTRDELTQAVKEFAEVHDQWRSDPGAVQLTPEWWLAAEQLVETVDRSDVEPDAWRLTLAIDDFAHEVKSEPVRAEQEHRMVRGSASLWRAWENVLNASLVPPQRPRLEPLSQLERQGASLQVMAKIYEEPIDRIACLLADKDSPEYRQGKPNPVDEREHSELEKAWESRELNSAQPEEAKKPAPESLADLLYQKVSAAQIKLIRPGTTDEQIAKTAAAIGVTPPSGAIHPPLHPVERIKRQDDEKASREAREHRLSEVDPPDGLDLPDSVLWLREQGLDAEEIAIWLNRNGWPEVTGQSAANILAQAVEA